MIAIEGAVVAAAVLGATGAAIAVVHRRARLRAARRAAALTRLAEAARRAAAELEGAATRTSTRPRITLSIDPCASPARDPATGLPGRGGFVDALRSRVDEARTADRRLALAHLVVEGGGTELDDALGIVGAAARAAAPDGELFRTGEHALALLLPGVGRAGALAAIARIEATLDGRPAMAAHAVELEHGEDAIAFLARSAAAG